MKLSTNTSDIIDAKIRLTNLSINFIEEIFDKLHFVRVTEELITYTHGYAQVQ